MTANLLAAKLQRLRDLASTPGDQVAYAAHLVDAERNPDLVLAALAVLAARPSPTTRPLLLRRYAHYDANGTRRDPGGALRTAILRTLRPMVLGEDVALLERAVLTYEFLYGEATGDLRAAALLALHEVDDVLAGYHAVRLLTDPHTSIMSGEPAVTAVRVLAARGQSLPLYAYVTRDEAGVGDVVAESLRNLATLPASLLPALVEKYRASTDEIVLLGLFDLLLAHPARPAYTDFILEFLRATSLMSLYRALVMMLVASRDAAMRDHLAALAASERNRTKADILHSALDLG